VLAIQPYVPGKSSAPGVARIHKLSSNETPLGPSPKAIAAYQSVAAHLQDYPDGAATKLREAIGRAFGLDPARIVCGAGSDDLLNLLARAYLADGDEAIHTTHGFLVYPIATLGAGAPGPVVAAEKTTPPMSCRPARGDGTHQDVFLANPIIRWHLRTVHERSKRLHRGLPPRTLLVLDAAYAEYVRRMIRNPHELVATSENVVMSPDFFRVPQLAAARWMYGPALDATRQPHPRAFNVNSAAIAAGAAIEDVGHVERSTAHNAKWLAWLTEEIGKLGLEVTPSVANFVLIHFPHTGRTAAEADKFLSARGLILRQVGAYGLPHALRMSVGTEEANRLVVAALKEFIGRQ
jgi:histidinol-phosphate aminotransferase